MDNDTIKDLGLCPICQKGHIMKGSLGYSCNYFKNMNDKCTFNIYHSYWGKALIREICEKAGITPVAQTPGGVEAVLRVGRDEKKEFLFLHI